MGRRMYLLLSGKRPPVSMWGGLVREAALAQPLIVEESKLNLGWLSSHSWEDNVGIGGELDR